MPEAGYIYVLINPSMDGLVKIGKTTRDPTGRGKELSGATGVPSPFRLAYEALISDCSAAEEFVHTLLEQKGYRVSSNREFFNCSLNEAIKAVIQAEAVFGTAYPAQLRGADSQQDNDLESSLMPSPELAWEETLRVAEDHYYGHDLTIKDYAEAERLYSLAAKLGSSLACIMLGTIHKYGDGCNKDSAAAISFFRQGIRLGDDRCWAEMAQLFTQDHSSVKPDFEDSIANARKCWARYFGSGGFRDDRPTDHVRNRLWHALIYLGDVASGTVPLMFNAELSLIKDELLTGVREQLDMFKRHKTTHAISSYGKLLRDLETQL